MGSSSFAGCTLSYGVCVALLALACCVMCARGAVPALYVLGDSQADVGNNNYLPESLLKANFPHNGVDYPGGKATGRFSNGYNFVDLLGGAGVSDLTNKGQCISFDEQIERDYSQVEAALVQQLGQPQASIHLAKSLFVVAIGGNDIINHVLLSPASQLIRSQDQIITSLADTLKRQLQSMYGLGMRRLFFLGGAPLGCCPLLLEQSPNKECHAEANYLSARYNVAVTALLRDMGATHPDMSYVFFDTYTTLLQYIQEPEAHVMYYYSTTDFN
ncbi:hypothetical protein E2562_013409 [Oryza meyeriana var. granulata]|uniref:GDSL esterase/lipase n=1 Tax=Oryza meyeriana var. granulata TaxID=110450 RepID=A0A6G1EB74_9ORYZ|nr:hypothetical protein E2562_013409 [Oryza meyeriana var. granulata]